MTQEMKEKMERLANEYKLEDFKHNPDGYTISPWCNSDHAACAFEAGFTACYELMSDKIERTEAQNQRLRVDSKLTALKECQEKLTIAIGALEKYEPYCVPMFVDCGDPEFLEHKEVWLAREALAQIKGGG
jgi:hypothetical protein